MRLALPLALLLLAAPAPAFACRCYAKFDTVAEREAHAARIAVNAKTVAIGRFSGPVRGGIARFAVRRRLAGTARRHIEVRIPGFDEGFGELIYSGSCTWIRPWTDRDRALVLRPRRPDEHSDEPGLPDACATAFLRDHPELLETVAAAARKRRAQPAGLSLSSLPPGPSSSR